MRFKFGRKFSLLAAATIALASAAIAQTAPPVTLEVHLDQVKAEASPMLHGLMTEEINYSYDGGLYAELIPQRRSPSE